MKQNNSKWIVLLLVLTVLLSPCEKLHAHEESNASQSQTNTKYNLEENLANGILPQLGVLLRIPKEYRLYDPKKPQKPEEHIEYNRHLPFFAEEVINQGYALPSPFGISLIGVYNDQAQDITDINVALQKGSAPDEDADLRHFPTVTIDARSVTKSPQLKADVWLFPFLNLYASVGNITGDVDIKVNILETEICIPTPGPRPPICNEFSNSFLLPIKANVDSSVFTVGFTGVYSIDKWYTALSGSYSETFSGKATSVNTTNFGVRAGRRFFLKDGILLSPFFGLNYMKLDTRVQGTTQLNDAFSDGDALYVRYDIHVENVDKYSGSFGLNVGFKNDSSVTFEWAKSQRSDRIVLSGGIRF